MLTIPQRNCVLATQSGLVHPFMLRAGEIRIEDIALALSNIPRYGGHTRPALSVAQHCVDGAKFLRREGEGPGVQLAFLLHDAGEAYSGDSLAPILPFFPSVRRFRKRLQQAIYTYFLGAEPDTRTRLEIKEMDLEMRALEMRHLFPHWRKLALDLIPPPGWEHWRGPIPARQAEKEYLDRFHALQVEWEAERYAVRR